MSEELDIYCLSFEEIDSKIKTLQTQRAFWKFIGVAALLTHIIYVI
jgi:hypothetical protein